MNTSIVLATYNGVRHIQAQLASIACQSRLPDELIVTDDASTDETLDIVARFAKNAQFDVRYWSNDRNYGYTKNFELGLAAASGDLVFLSDQDDVWCSNKLETMCNLAETTEFDVFVNDAWIVDEELRTEHMSLVESKTKKSREVPNLFTGCCMAVRREFLHSILPIPQGFRGHDRWIGEIAGVLQRKLVYPHPLQLFRRHDQTASTVKIRRTNVRGRVVQLARDANRALRTRANRNEPSAEWYRRQLDLYRNGILGIEGRFTDTDRIRLTEFRKALNQRERLFGERVDVQAAECCIARMALGLQLWRRGGYKQFKGVETCLRDVVLR